MIADGRTIGLWAPGVPLAARPALVRALRETALALAFAGAICACLVQLGDRAPRASAAEVTNAADATYAFPIEMAAAESLVARAPGSIEGIIAEVFGVHARAAIRVARCDSNLQPSVVSDGRGSWGLFQINRVHEDLVASMGYEWRDLLDPRVNTLVAKVIFDTAGDWSPWDCAWAAG